MNSEQTTYRPVPTRPIQLSRALSAFNALAPGEQRAVLQQYERLSRARMGQGAWTELEPLGKAVGLKLLRVEDHLIVSFRLVEGRQPDVFDIARG